MMHLENYDEFPNASQNQNALTRFHSFRRSSLTKCMADYNHTWSKARMLKWLLTTMILYTEATRPTGNKIEILCGYAIRQGRHPLGSQRPPGRPGRRPLPSRGMSAWPYRVTTKYSFYPVQTYKFNKDGEPVKWPIMHLTNHAIKPMGQFDWANRGE